MDLGARLAVLAAALLLAVGITVTLRVLRGRLRTIDSPAAIPAGWAAPGAEVTLVQLSSPACSACVRSERVWREAVADRPGVAFREVDAQEHLDVVRELGVLTTPTTLVYDSTGTLRGRIGGAPTPRQAADLLDHDTIGASR